MEGTGVAEPTGVPLATEGLLPGGRDKDDVRVNDDGVGFGILPAACCMYSR